MSFKFNTNLFRFCDDAMQVSGVVWFKHKYLTNPSVTPEDQIVAAIGGLAKTLTNGVPLQLCNDTVDKLCKLQEILEPRTDGNDERKVMAPTQQAPVPWQSPRLEESNNHDPAAVPRVAQEYAILPRVLESMCMDTTEYMYPRHEILGDGKAVIPAPMHRPSPQQPKGPR